MAGAELCRRLKSDAARAAIPVVLVGDDGSVSAKIEALDSGCVDYITKPFISEVVLARATVQTKMYRMQQKIAEQAARLRSEVEERKVIEGQLQQGKEHLERLVALRTAEFEKSESHLKQAQAIANIGSWDNDLVKGELVWSEETYKIFNLPVGSETSVEKFFSMVHPDDIERLAGEWEAALSNMKVFDVVHRIVVGDEVKWVREKAEIYFDGGQTPLRAVGVVQDITEQLSVEHSLRESEQRYRSLFEEIIDVVYRTDAEGVITVVSPSCQKMLGYSQAELLGKRMQDLYVNPEDRDLFVKAIRAEGRQENFESELRNKDGAIITISTNARALTGENGEFLGVEGVSRDLTPIKRAEKAREEAESNYSKLFNMSRDGYAIVKGSGEILHANPAFIEMLGYSMEEVASLSWRDLSPGHWLEWEIETHAGPLLERGYTDLYEKEYVRKDGSLFPVQLQAFLLNESVTVEGAIIAAFARDISELKKIETERKSLKEQLLQTQKLDAIGTLAGGIAHDFNNILGAILGFTEVAILESDPNSEAVEDLHEVVSAAKRAKKLVNQILTFSHSSEEMKELVPVHQVVGEAMRLLRKTIPSTIDFSLDIAKDDDTVFADPTQLHQVVINLCTNAYHAMRAEGGTLSVTLSPTEIDEAGARSLLELSAGSYLMLRVADTGEGMPKEIADKIFEPFSPRKIPAREPAWGCPWCTE